MMKDIRKRLTDYFFAGDIYEAHQRYERNVRETIADDAQLYDVLRNRKNLKILDFLGSSAIPNLLECAGIGLSIYHNDLIVAAIYGLCSEVFRLRSRSIAKSSLETLNNLNSLIGVLDMHASDRDDAGEEWKR